MKHSKLTRRRFVQGSLALLAAGGLNLKASAAGKSDTLVVYLSRTGNNKALAQFIAQSTGADLAAIETAKPYPQNYAQMRDQAAQEIADGVLPPLKNMPNTEPYRRIVIVFPTWAMRLPAPGTICAAKPFCRSTPMPVTAWAAALRKSNSWQQARTCTRACRSKAATNATAFFW